MAQTRITPCDPFALRIAPETFLARAASVAARPILSAVLGMDALRDVYESARQTPGPTFEAQVLQALGVKVGVRVIEGSRIPVSGAMIAAANHPTGALDGLVVAEAIGQVRTDVRILTNHLLERIPELAASCFFVDPFAGPAAAARSRSGLRAAHLWLRSGGALVMFPAGEVAWQSNADGRVDSEWNTTLERLASATGASIVPVYVEGRNSRLFYTAGRVHPLLRTALLGRELLNKRGTTVQVHVGAAIPPSSRIPGLTLTAAARRSVDALSTSSRRAPDDVEAAVDPEKVAADVDALTDDTKLLTSGEFDVFCAGAESLPHVLRELGRLREITFRRVGEGTGRATDLDRFDMHYQHLFVWNRTRREVAGAYRVAATDAVVPHRGVDGLYTSTLFTFEPALLDRLGPALELGRSFVRTEYQRRYNPLLLLWKGIGEFVARSPRYRVLFGPVSISNRYQDSSQQLLRAFLAQEHGNATLAELVQARNPPSPLVPPARDAVVRADAARVDALVRQIEGTDGMPILLRQYLRLNASVLGFNVDPAFGNALDALMMVDLTRVGSSLLQRYLGRAGAAAFAEYHRQRAIAA